MPNLVTWNKILAEYFFPAGSDGLVRLSLTDADVNALSDIANINSENFRSDLYTACCAEDIPSSLDRQLRRYSTHSYQFSERWKKQTDADELNRLISEYTDTPPPFLSHLVVVVDAYMHGSEEDPRRRPIRSDGRLDSNDVYQLIANGIHQELEVDTAEGIGNRMRAPGTGWNARARIFDSLVAIPNHDYDDAKQFDFDRKPSSAFMHLQYWTKARNQIIGGCKVLLTPPMKRRGGSQVVGQIKFHAPFRGSDLTVARTAAERMVRQGLRRPSRDTMLASLQLVGGLSATARRSIEEGYIAPLIDEVDIRYHEALDRALAALSEQETEAETLASQVETAEDSPGEPQHVRLVFEVTKHYDESFHLRAMLVTKDFAGEDFIVNGENLNSDSEQPLRSVPITDAGLSLDDIRTATIERSDNDLTLSLNNEEPPLFRILRWSGNGSVLVEDDSPYPGLEVHLLSNRETADSYASAEFSPDSSSDVQLVNTPNWDGEDLVLMRGMTLPRDNAASEIRFRFKGGIGSDGSYLRTAPPIISRFGGSGKEIVRMSQRGKDEEDDDGLELREEHGEYQLRKTEQPGEVLIKIQVWKDTETADSDDDPDLHDKGCHLRNPLDRVNEFYEVT